MSWCLPLERAAVLVGPVLLPALDNPKRKVRIAQEGAPRSIRHPRMMSHRRSSAVLDRIADPPGPRRRRPLSLRASANSRFRPFLLGGGASMASAPDVTSSRSTPRPARRPAQDAGLFNGDAAFNPVCRGNADKHGLVLGEGFSDGFTNLQGQPHAVFKGTAIFVLAMVRNRRKELVEGRYPCAAWTSTMSYPASWAFAAAWTNAWRTLSMSPTVIGVGTVSCPNGWADGAIGIQPPSSN